MYLIHNCTNQTSSNKKYKEIECDSNQHGDAFWAVYEEDLYPREFGTCVEVKVPYDDDDESGGIEGELKRGIVLNYISNSCVFNNNTSEFLCFCADKPHRSSCHPDQKTKFATRLLGLGLVIGFSSVGILGLIALWCCLRMIKNRRANLNVETFLKSYGSLAPKRYTFSDLRKMTNSFKENVGKGGFGAVYKGKTPNGRLVAVKLLNQLKGDGEDFINEVASMSTTNHVNVVTLLGFCIEGDKRALIYEFMVNGSLDKFTKDEINGQSLTWETTFQISLGIARGLEYLHRGCNTRILHFDIKPHNILLDENFRPKISDFGLAKLHPQDKQSGISMPTARGTIGYIAPEVFCRNFGEVSHKSDVYSYGMMILEVIGSRRRMNIEGENLSSDLYFPDWIYKQLERSNEQDFDGIMDDEEKELKRKMILVSLWCIQTVPLSRPSMSRVVQMLETSAETLEIPPMPSLASPPRTQSHPSWSSSTMTLR